MKILINKGKTEIVQKKFGVGSRFRTIVAEKLEEYILSFNGYYSLTNINTGYSFHACAPSNLSYYGNFLGLFGRHWNSFEFLDSDGAWKSTKILLWNATLNEWGIEVPAKEEWQNVVVQVGSRVKINNVEFIIAQNINRDGTATNGISLIGLNTGLCYGFCCDMSSIYDLTEGELGGLFSLYKGQRIELLYKDNWYLLEKW